MLCTRVKSVQASLTRAFATAAASASAAGAAAAPAKAAAAAAAAATSNPYTPSTKWGPKVGDVAAALPKPRPSRAPRGSPENGAKYGRKLPLSHTRLAGDNPNSKTEQYELHSAVIVERWPKILKDEPQWKLDYHAHFAELRKAKKQRHAIPAQLQPKKEDLPPVETATGPVDPSDLLTEADRANDLRATHRCLQDSLYLIVKRRGGAWQFPSGIVPFDVNGWDTAVPDVTKLLNANVREATAMLGGAPIAKDTLRSVGESALASVIGTHASVYFMGNAPLAVHRVQKADAAAAAKKPADAAAAGATKTTVVGTKTFFMHALFMDGEVRLQNAREFEDFAWVKRDQLTNYIGQEQADLLATVLLDAE